MATPIPATFAQILLAIQAQLETWLGLPPERVLLVDPQVLGIEHPQGDSYLWVWPATQTPDRPRFEGAGRFDRRATVRVEVGIRTRCALDESTSAAIWATDPTLGHCTLWLAVCDALDCYQPTDTGLENGNWLVTQPIVPAGGGRPRLNKGEKEWGETVLGFDVSFQLQLTQSYQ